MILKPEKHFPPSFASCEVHITEMMGLFKKKSGEPLLWVRIRGKGKRLLVKLAQ